MSVVSHQPKRCGPDFFGYYVHEIVDSLSSLSVGPADNVNMSRDGKEVHDGVSSNKALFHGIIGNSMLEVNKELFKALLREALNTLTIEVDEILDPIICIRHIMFHVKAKEQQATRPLTVPSIPSSSTLVHADANNATPGGQFDAALKCLIEIEDSKWVEQKLKKHSEELSSTLHYMEQHLEELLNTAVSQFRSMTQLEKQQLRIFILKLPPENLERVVAIISQSKGVPKTLSHSDEIFIELENLDSVTLWRLFFYVKATENARGLSHK